MKHKLNAVASVSMLGTLLGCAPLMPVAPLAGSSAAASRAQAGAMPVKVAPVSAVSPAMPSNEALYTMGRAAHGAGQLALAAQRYEQVLKRAPDHVGALNALAVIYAQSDRTDEALKLFVRASNLALGVALVHNNTGYALLRAGRLDEAERALKQARELDPSNLQTQQNLALLARAQAERQPAVRAVESGAEDKAAPRLVVESPNVFELQMPASAQAAAAGPIENNDASSGSVAGAGEKAAPTLVAVAPNVYALQAPVTLATGIRAATNPVQVAAGPFGRNLSPAPALSAEVMLRLAEMAARAELRGVRLEVSNGVGISNLARRTADRLATEGVLTARLTNAKPYRQAKTEIQFVTGQAPAAQALQSRLPVAARAVPASRLNAGVQLRLVLGHDVAGRAIAAWLDGGEQQQVATATQGGGWRWS